MSGTKTRNTVHPGKDRCKKAIKEFATKKHTWICHSEALYQQSSTPKQSNPESDLDVKIAQHTIDKAFTDLPL